MNPLVRTNIQDHVAVVLIDNPPVNALTTGVPQGVANAVREANRNGDIRAILVMGAGRTFAAGADIHEFVRYVAGEGPWPEFHRWLNQIEDSAKPVVMAMHGQAFGAGLELALCGHYRVMAVDAQVGQPEVNIGLIPGAAGTVRLPRLAGIEKAGEMIAFGQPLTARAALEAGIVDQVIEGDLLEGALAFARTVTAPRRTRELTVRGEIGALAALRARCRPHLDAPLAAIEVIEKIAALNFEQGCAVEAEIFRKLMNGPQSKSLIHAFFAERAASKVPGIGPETPILSIRRAAVVGAGTMGGGIAMALANVGIPVILTDADGAALERGLATIRKNYERSVQGGRMSVAEVAQRMAHITPQTNYDGFYRVDLVIEAVFESLELKKRIFTELDAVTKPDCLLASNTSTLDIDQLAAVTTRAPMVLGLHFFSPANVMRLLEIVRGGQTAPTVLATAMQLAKTMKKVGVVVGNGFGFVGNRLFIPYMNAAECLVEEGASPEQVDRALMDFGMAMGPFAVADLSGLDVFMRIRQERPHSSETVGLPILYRLGRFGQKSGAGWFRYGHDRKPQPDAEVVALVQAAAGRAPRTFTDQEIVDRCMGALIAEARKVMEEGLVSKASDIDVIYMAGYGFPAWRGGPMFYAELLRKP